ncbi:MAG TPA: hypothetical protein VFD30_21895, partial [Terriglobia bacterium]|nr:hypothetical protein [Terriglobia bacterium]
MNSTPETILNSPEKQSGAFERAIIYCVAYDAWGPEPAGELLKQLREGKGPSDAQQQQLVVAVRLALTKPQPGPETEHLQKIAEAAKQVGDPKVGLVMGGATKIKQYVF